MRLSSWRQCKPLCRVLASLLYWKNVLVALLLTSFATVALIQRYQRVTQMRFLLERNFVVSTPLDPDEAGRQKTLTGAEKVGQFEPSECPRSIASLPRYSQWFRERFKPNIKLFLDRLDSYNLGNLSFYELPYGFKNENHTYIRTLLHHARFKNAPLHLRTGRECISCAVVGSGGILNGSGAGREIDAHDVVFRLNAAFTDGRYAEDVGRKTDFYMFFPESAHLGNIRNKNVTLLYTMYKSFDVMYIAKMIHLTRPSRHSKIDTEKLKIIHPDFFRYAFAKFLDAKSMKPTTGAMVVLLAVHLCDSVTIYGFGYDARFSMHYYDWSFMPRTYQSTWTHDVENERRLWDKLHHEGAIRFFKRDVVG